MGRAQISIRELKSVVRRRWRYPVFITLSVTAACAIGAFSLARKYESSTTILFRPDQTLNPIAGYDMLMAYEDQLRNFNEILLSRSLLQTLADSLGMIRKDAREEEIQSVVGGVAANLSTTRLGTDSFRILFSSTEPVRAKRGAELAANLFIKTKTSVQTRQNALTVQFYEEKVAEYKRDFESTVQTMVSGMKQRVQQMPVEERALYGQVEEIGRQIGTAESKRQSLRENLSVLNFLPDSLEHAPSEFRKEDGKQPLYDLERSEVPYSNELRTLVRQYDDLTRRYKGEYPEVVRQESQIIDLLKKIRTAVVSELDRLGQQIADSERQRMSVVEKLKESSVTHKVDEEEESSYATRRTRYEEMRAKLEQARIAQEVSERGANQFIILDPALLPISPTKPNRSMIVVAGFAVGLLLGLFAGLFAELMDTTIRIPVDVEVYNKPIIAYIPDRTTANRPVRRSR